MATVPEQDRNAGRRLPAPKLGLPVEPLALADTGFLGTPGFYLRVGALVLLALAAFAVLLVRLWSLQVLGWGRYRQVAQRQAVRILEAPAPRGAIVDRRGRPLAGTEAELVLTATPRALGTVGADGSWRPSKQGRAVLRRLAGLTGQPVTELLRRVGTSVAAVPYADPVVLRRLPRALSFYLDERGDAFPGLRVEARPVRSYPQGALGEEFLGLVGEISPEQLTSRHFSGYRPGDLVGRSGIEASYERILRGGSVSTRVPVDALGYQTGRATVRRPRPPLGLRLTIDARLQRAAERAIRDGIGFAHAAGHPDARAGAAVVLDPRTGAILALASYPGFNQVAAAQDPGYLSRLLAPVYPARLLLNRATQGLYPPGSTFKPIVAEAALASGLITPNTVLPCTGSLQVGDTVFHNVEPGIDAFLTLPQALEISCDTWFYRLGVAFYRRQVEQGGLDLQAWASRLGFGRRTGLDLPGEQTGLVPTPAWLRRTYTSGWHRTWYEGDSVNLSIGQGLLLVTPLQLAVAYAALANGGTIVRPHLGDAVLSPAGRVDRQLRFPPRARLRLIGLPAVRDGLFRAAHDPGGTSAAIFGDFPVPVAGKTGTAQAPSGSDHSWYASWAPAANPHVVVVVLIEHGGFGAQAAAPAAKEIYTALFATDGRRSRRG